MPKRRSATRGGRRGCRRRVGRGRRRGHRAVEGCASVVVTVPVAAGRPRPRAPGDWSPDSTAGGDRHHDDRHCRPGGEHSTPAPRPSASRSRHHPRAAVASTRHSTMRMASFGQERTASSTISRRSSGGSSCATLGKSSTHLEDLGRDARASRCCHSGRGRPRPSRPCRLLHLAASLAWLDEVRGAADRRPPSRHSVVTSEDGPAWGTTTARPTRSACRRSARAHRTRSPACPRAATSCDPPSRDLERRSCPR